MSARLGASLTQPRAEDLIQGFHPECLFWNKNSHFISLRFHLYLKLYVIVAGCSSLSARIGAFSMLQCYNRPFIDESVLLEAESPLLAFCIGVGVSRSRSFGHPSAFTCLLHTYPDGPVSAVTSPSLQLDRYGLMIMPSSQQTYHVTTCILDVNHSCRSTFTLLGQLQNPFFCPFETFSSSTFDLLVPPAPFYVFSPVFQLWTVFAYCLVCRSFSSYHYYLTDW